MANFYNIYNPAQGTVGGLLTLPNFANPVQFICGGTFDVGASPDNYKRAEICRQRMGPVFKRITMNYPPIMFHPINSITAYKGQIIYDTPADRGQSADPRAVPAMAERAGSDTAADTAGCRPDLAAGSARARRCAGSSAAATTSHAGGPLARLLTRTRRRPPHHCPQREQADDAQGVGHHLMAPCC